MQETIQHNEINPIKNVEKIEDNLVIQISGLCKSFGKNNAVLKGVNLEVKRGENVVVLGKSGSGKSITIKCLVGLVVPDEGSIKVFNTDISNLDNNDLNLIRIKIGFLFQNAALYDSMTVKENLEFPLKRHQRNCSQKELNDKVIEAITKSKWLFYETFSLAKNMFDLKETEFRCYMLNHSRGIPWTY